jgi:hypothetical protein
MRLFDNRYNQPHSYPTASSKKLAEKKSDRIDACESSDIEVDIYRVSNKIHKIFDNNLQTQDTP